MSDEVKATVMPKGSRSSMPLRVSVNSLEFDTATIEKSKAKKDKGIKYVTKLDDYMVVPANTYEIERKEEKESTYTAGIEKIADKDEATERD